MTAKQPKPDEFGRFRVRDEDTGHEYSINAPALAHGNYTVLDEAASTPGGEALPPVHKSLSSPTSGQSAGTKKENGND